MAFLETAMSPVGKISPFMGGLYLTERYETVHGIFNHDTPEAEADSLSLLRFHQTEDPMLYSQYRLRLVEYTDKEVNKWFGLNFKEFIQQPRMELELMLEMCETLQKREYQEELKRRQLAEEAARVAKPGAS